MMKAGSCRALEGREMVVTPLQPDVVEPSVSTFIHALAVFTPNIFQQGLMSVTFSRRARIKLHANASFEDGWIIR